MANPSHKDKDAKEPEGLGEHARGSASEAAHEQGWDLNEDQRTKEPQKKPPHFGGKDYDYGAQDFGDTPSRTGEAPETPDESSGKNRKPS